MRQILAAFIAGAGVTLFAYAGHLYWDFNSTHAVLMYFLWTIPGWILLEIGYTVKRG